MPIDTPQLLYPEVEPYDRGWLEVSGGHRIYYEQSGSRGGRPVLLLHGGPGSASSPMQRRFFDPERYRIVQFDQRGCGRSEPAGGLRHNQTALLVDDIEALRERLAIERWLVSGGSWGATLAVVYGALNRQRLDGVLARAVFLGNRADLDWFFGGAGALHPQTWQEFLALAPRSRRRNFRRWLWQVFAGPDAGLQGRVALAWRNWESALAGAPPAQGTPLAAVESLVRRYRVQAHYLSRQCFLGRAGAMGSVARLHGVPVLWLHGRRDLVCRPLNSWQAWRSLAGSRLLWVDDGGHDPFAASMAEATRRATDGFAASGDFALLGVP